MGRTLALMLVRHVLGVLGCVGAGADAVEIAVLRHQLAVCAVMWRARGTRRGIGCCWPCWPGCCHASDGRRFWSPRSTLLRWHRELVARRWTFPGTGGGRRGLVGEVIELVVRLARENPRWGYLRIVGECRTRLPRFEWIEPAPRALYDHGRNVGARHAHRTRRQHRSRWASMT